MARPIPTNPAGLQGRYRVVAAPTWAGRGRPRPAPPLTRPDGGPPAALEAGQPRPHRQLLLLSSALTGLLAIVSALEDWLPLATSALDDRGTFWLLVAGAYVLGTALYAAWRTRLLHELDQAPGDVQLMAYANLGVGGVVSLVLGLMALAAVAILGLVIAVLALLLSSSDER